ncbi:hypothetical protein [Chitinophaga nivalis]|uniref:Right handed beta helix domain-containing protein n=1 Tax=Chitinophaga nivalis TaxID=2991709 RepID=A0ABT3IMU1_9BACT|nr:hypothetical protein [Chitinophaga nivalis]MCW3465028.1 hypothetical protein [Chitinophaga nivalis]MCW3485280.1 hypothetical protein [Chitinophaga nivalis]
MTPKDTQTTTLTTTPQTGTIVVNGVTISYTVAGEKITYSDGKFAFPSIYSTDFVKAYETATQTPVAPDPNVVGTGSGELLLGTLSNASLKIKPGNYSFIYIASATNVKIDATDVVLNNGSMEVDQANTFELWGLSVINQPYRALTIRGNSNDVYLHDLSFKNIGDYTIHYDNRTIYDGSPATVSKNWKFERLTYENTSCGFFCRGEFAPNGVEGLMRNFKFVNNTIKNCPEIGNVVWMGAVEDYEIAGNVINNINTLYTDPNAPNGYHNGIFQMMGNGSFHDNKITNHQGNAIRAWGMSFGTTVKEVLIYNNIVWNSWKYSAFELQLAPYLYDYIQQYPARVTHTNAKVYNNTAGHLNVSQDWEGQQLDLYNTYGTLEYYNNVGFEMVKAVGPVTNMINNMSGTVITRSDNNHYFPTQQQAVVDTVNFQSLVPGAGAQ